MYFMNVLYEWSLVSVKGCNFIKSNKNHVSVKIFPFTTVIQF